MGKIKFIFVIFSLAGCVQHVVLPVKPLKTTEISEVWKNVKLEKVTGAEQTLLEATPNLFYHLGIAPTKVLEKVLLARIGTGGNREYLLTVENVKYAISLKTSVDLNPEGSFGISADFILKKGAETKRISLEHSVNVPVVVQLSNEAKENVYSMAVVDLTDQLFFNPDALAFLNSPPQLPKDSALLGKVDVGPVMQVNPSQRGTLSTGRILWDSLELETDAQAIIMLGDAKGAFGAMYTRQSWKNFGLRVQVGFGYLSMSSGVNGESTGAFSMLGNFGIELGYRGTNYTEAGYVDYPGFSFLIVPQLSFFDVVMSEAGVLMYMYGGSAEAEIPLGRHLGIIGGVFVGSGVGFVSAGGFSTSFDLGTIWYPLGDIFIQTSTGRISLGLAFQQLMSGEGESDIFKNPTITLSYKAWAGRGIAYSKSKAEIKGWNELEKEEVQSTPYNVFTHPSSKTVEY